MLKDGTFGVGSYRMAGGARVPRSEPASFGGSEHAPPLRKTKAATTLPPSGREVARLSRNFSLRLSVPHRGAVTEGACG